MKFEAFIFDMDDTLTEFTIENRLLFYYEWLKKLEIEKETINKVLKEEKRADRVAILGINEKKYVEEYLPVYATVDIELRKKLLSENNFHLKEGAIELLSAIKQPKILVSQSSKEAVVFTLENFGLAKYFDYVHYRNFNIKLKDELIKPNPKLAELIFKELNLKPSKKIALIGDSKRDLEFAINLGLTSIIIGNEKIESDYSFKNLIELKEFLKL